MRFYNKRNLFIETRLKGNGVFETPRNEYNEINLQTFKPFGMFVKTRTRIVKEHFFSLWWVMNKIGICAKCGEYKEVRNHHFNGYDEEHKDDVALYCQRCDRQAHNKARREGRCKLTAKETKQKSFNSYRRRNVWRCITLHDKLDKGVYIKDKIDYCETRNILNFTSDIVIRG